MIDSNKTYVGVVEDNQDPNRIGRVKIRVMGIFDDIPLEDIPWAMPWKDLNGNEFNVPEIGKVVIVIFDDGNENNPEFIYSDHYNINLEEKLKSLSDEDYTSMKSIIFDHKTQIYVNDSEGLKIDHKYNNLNITNGGVDINLKDNNASLNLGDSTASQQAILGNHFLDWVGKFLEALQSGSLMNQAGPAVPNPAMLKLIVEFNSLKDLNFLSHHVNIADNNKITTVNSEEREDDPQYGDTWTSTKEDNELTSKKEESFASKEGPKDEYNKPISIPVSQNQDSQTAENEIAVQTGLTPNRIAELKQAASLISIELETGSNLSWWDNLTNIAEFSEIKKLLIGINSTAEMQVLSSFYKNIFTLNGNLYQDIAQEFSADEVATIPFLSSIA